MTTETNPDLGGPAIPPSPRKPRADEPLYQTLLMPLGVLLFYGALVAWLLVPDQPFLKFAFAGMGVVFMITSTVLRPDGLSGLYQQTFHWSKAYQLNNWILVLAVVGIFVVVNIVFHRHSRKYDFTQQQLYSLSDQTKQLLAGLKDEVKVTGFFPEYRNASQEAMIWASARRKVKELLDDYQRYANGKLKVDLVDPLRDPTAARPYGLGEGDWGTVFLEQKGGRKVKVARDKIFSRASPFGGGASFKGEEAITGAMLDLESGKKIVVYFLEGHGEKPLQSEQPTGYSVIKGMLERERYEIKTWSLSRGKVPDDCNVLIVAGPTQGFPPRDVENLRTYLNTQGKGALMLLDSAPQAGLKELMAEFGIEWSANIIVELDPNNTLDGNAVAVVTQARDHAITKLLVSKKKDPALHEATYLNKLAKPAEKFEFTPLIETIGVQGWAEYDLQSLQGGRIKMDQNVDKHSPLTLGWAIEIKQGPPAPKKPEDAMKPPEEKKDEGPRSRIVAIGDSDFATDLMAMMYPTGANTDLFLNSVAWAAFASEKTGTIRPKEDAGAPITLTTDAKLRIGRFTIIVYPLTVLVLGILVWFRRSNL